MASKGASARAAARKQRDMWKSKRWYDIRAPRNPWSYRVIGETLGEEDEIVVGRIFEMTQHELDGDFSRMHVKLRFRITETLNSDALTEFIGHSMMKDHMRRQVRRYRGKVDDVIDVVTVDGYHIRIKPLIISQRRINTSRKAAMREATRDVILQMSGTSTWVDLQRVILDGTMERSINDAAGKIHPVRNVMIRKSELCQSGVVVDDGPSLDEIVAEEERARAAEAVAAEASSQSDVLAAAEASEAISETVADDAEEVSDPEKDGDLLEAEAEIAPEDEGESEADAPAEDDGGEAVEESEIESSSEEDLGSLTVAELKERLKAAGKPVSGKKAELIARLLE